MDVFTSHQMMTRQERQLSVTQPSVIPELQGARPHHTWVQQEQPLVPRKWLVGHVWLRDKVSQLALHAAQYRWMIPELVDVFSWERQRWEASVLLSPNQFRQYARFHARLMNGVPITVKK